MQNELMVFSSSYRLGFLVLLISLSLSFSLSFYFLIFVDTLSLTFSLFASLRGMAIIIKQHDLRREKRSYFHIIYVGANEGHRKQVCVLPGERGERRCSLFVAKHALTTKGLSWKLARKLQGHHVLITFSTEGNFCGRNSSSFSLSLLLQLLVLKQFFLFFQNGSCKLRRMSRTKENRTSLFLFLPSLLAMNITIVWLPLEFRSDPPLSSSSFLI